MARQRSKTRNSKPEAKKSRRNQGERSGRSLIDLASAMIGPFLIMLMMASVGSFFVEAFYEGYYAERLNQILLAFSVASVLISRISITMGKKRASIYGIALAGVSIAVVFRYMENPYPPLVCLAIMWWCAKKLTWDCTLANEEEDASGEGLLQITGLEKRLEPAPQKRAIWKRLFSNKSEREGQPHAPGLWILYFSLAAVPIFGLGQFLIETTGQEGAGAESRRYAFTLLGVYLASSLALLLTTSLLGLRRYLKQREVRLPGRIVRTWIAFGMLFIALIMGIGFILPRPDVQADFEKIAALTDYLKVGTINRDEVGFLGTRYDVTEDDPDLDPNLEIDVPLEEEEPEEPEIKEKEPLPEPKEEKTEPEQPETPEEEKPDPEVPEEKKPEEPQEPPAKTEVAQSEPETPEPEKPEVAQVATPETLPDLLNMELMIPDKLEEEVLANVRNSQYADFNGDGYVDAAFSMAGAGTRIWLNNQEGTLVDTKQVLAADGSHDPGKTAEFLVVGDLDQDEDIDLLLVDATHGASVWLNDATGKFTVKPDAIEVPAEGLNELKLVDLDDDDDLDLILVNNQKYQNFLVPNEGDGSFLATEALSVAGQIFSNAVAVADFDGDRQLDLVFANENPQHPVDLWLNTNKKNRRFQRSEQVFEEGSRKHVVAGDIDRDGDPDLLFTNTDTYEVEIWLNQRTHSAEFVKSPQVLTGELEDAGLPYELVLEDFNNDRYLDVMVSTIGDRGILQIFSNEGSYGSAGTFGLAQEQPFVIAESGEESEEVGGWRTRLLDWDNDGDTDLVLHGKHNDRLYTLMNSQESMIEGAKYIPTDNRAGRAEGDELPSTFQFGSLLTPEELAKLEPPEPEESEEEEMEEEETLEAGSWNWPLILFLGAFLLLLGVLGWLANKFRAALKRMCTRFLNLFRKNKKPLEEEPKPEVDEDGNPLPARIQVAPPPPPKPFRKFLNPFKQGSSEEQSNTQVMCHTFSALESWAHEHDHERPPEQTPMEFCYGLEREYTVFENTAKKLSRWYTSYAYADREPEDDCRETLEKIWDVMESPLPTPEEEISEPVAISETPEENGAR